MTTLASNLAELAAVCADMIAAVERGENPTVFDANILEFHAQQAAVKVRNAFIESIVGRTPEEDRAAQCYLETRRDEEGVAEVIDDSEPSHSGLRDQRESAA